MLASRCFELPARQLLAQHDSTLVVEADEMEDVLADVYAEHGSGIFGLARHGGLLCSWAPRSTRDTAGSTAGPCH